MRICFFGDSFVHGTGDDDALGWVGWLTARARREGCDVTAYNLGVRRNTSADVAARWKTEAASRLSPENDGRLVFSFGANDCALGMTRTESLAHAEAILDSARRWLPTLMIGPGIIADSPEVSDSPAWSREALLGDGAHPSGGGYTIIADAVASWTAWREWMRQ